MTFVAGYPDQNNDYIDSQYDGVHNGVGVANVNDADWDNVTAGRYLLIEKTTGSTAGSFSWWLGSFGANAERTNSAITATGNVYDVSGILVGTVDATQDGQNGHALKVNLTSNSNGQTINDLLAACRTIDAKTG